MNPSVLLGYPEGRRSVRFCRDLPLCDTAREQVTSTFGPRTELFTSQFPAGRCLAPSDGASVQTHESLADAFRREYRGTQKGPLRKAESQVAVTAAT
jgi:hypothetical protein